MKILTALLALALSIQLFSQNTTYSKEEERMINYANNQWAKVHLDDPTQNPRKALDSCWSFLKKYPHSFAKPNVFNYMLEITFLVTKDTNKIYPLIDSVLYYDELPGTKENIGEHLIIRDIDVNKGRNYINSILPVITDSYHIYHSYILLARADIKQGDYPSAKANYEKALKAEPSRSEGWFEYLGYLSMMNLPDEASKLLQRIDQIEKEDGFTKSKCAYESRVINKNISDIVLKDYNDQPVKISSLKGKICVLKFFNYWHGYYKKEFEAMKNLEKEYPNVKFVFISYGNPPKDLRDRFLAADEFSFLNKHILLRGGDEFEKSLIRKNFPKTIVIDQKGKIRYDYYGYEKDIETTLHFNLQKLVN